MRWTKKQLFCIFLKMPKSLMFAVLALIAINLLSFFVFPSIDTYAVEDVVYTFDSSSSGTTYLCSSDFTPYCSDYSYLIIDYEGTPLSNYVDFINFVFFPTVANKYNSLFYSVSTSTVIDISSIDYQIRAVLSQGSGSYITSGSVVTITLSENNPFASGITPSGSLSITENGTFDVTNYAEAVVDVPQGGGGGQNYHDDLTSINNSILICGAVVLVIYFFYCIYRMFTKSTGGFK